MSHDPNETNNLYGKGWDDINKMIGASIAANRVRHNQIESTTLANKFLFISQIFPYEELGGYCLQTYARSFRNGKDVKPDESLMINALLKAAEIHKAKNEEFAKLQKEVAQLKKKIQDLESRNADDADNAAHNEDEEQKNSKRQRT